MRMRRNRKNPHQSIPERTLLDKLSIIAAEAWRERIKNPDRKSMAWEVEIPWGGEHYAVPVIAYIGEQTPAKLNGWAGIKNGRHAVGVWLPWHKNAFELYYTLVHEIIHITSILTGRDARGPSFVKDAPEDDPQAEMDYFRHEGEFDAYTTSVTMMMQDALSAVAEGEVEWYVGDVRLEKAVLMAEKIKKSAKESVDRLKYDFMQLAEEVGMSGLSGLSKVMVGEFRRGYWQEYAKGPSAVLRNSLANRFWYAAEEWLKNHEKALQHAKKELGSGAHWMQVKDMVTGQFMEWYSLLANAGAER